MAVNELSLMPKWKQLAFVARIANRLAPNFADFSEETGWGNPGFLSSTLERIWGQIERSDEMADARDLFRDCEQQMPDTEDFTSVLTSAALDAVGVICLCLEGLAGVSVQYIDAAQLAMDSIDLYLQFALDIAESEDVEDVVARHPLMLHELADQEASIKILKGDLSRNEAIRELKSLSTIRGSFAI